MAATPSARAASGARARWCCSSSRCSRVSISTAPIDQRRLHPHRGRVLEARLCRPRYLLRRSGFREGAGDVLLSDAYAEERRKLVSQHASLEQRPGYIPGFGMRLDIRVPDGDRLPAPGAGEPTVGRQVPGPHDDVIDPSLIVSTTAASSSAPASCAATPALDVIDRDGNMVSSTPSGGWLQSSPMIPELGFCLGTRAQQFWLNEGHPNAIGPASGRAPRCRRRWRCATASRISPGARRAATSRSVDRAVLLAPCPLRHEPAGGDRRAGLALRALPELVLAA